MLYENCELFADLIECAVYKIKDLFTPTRLDLYACLHELGLFWKETACFSAIKVKKIDFTLLSRRICYPHMFLNVVLKSILQLAVKLPFVIVMPA